MLRLRWFSAAAVAVAAALAASVYVFSLVSGAHQNLYAAPAVVPIASGGEAPAAALPTAVFLPVPYTSQAPLGNWAARQHTCEEASLVMVDDYLRGDHSGALISAQAADAAIDRITPWKPAVDLTPDQVGEVAQQHLGWAYQVLTADREVMRRQLALGRPLIVGVRTHGLGNPNYPGYFTHHEEPGWSVSHYLVVVGYERSGMFILNDPGLTRGQGYRISYEQLMYAIDDLDRAYPNLNAGRVFLVLAPPA